MLLKIFLIILSILLPLSFSYPQNKETLDLNLKIAEQLITAGRGSEAIEALEKLSEIHPENQQVFSLLSRAYLDAKSYSRFEVHLKNWLKKYPENWVVWVQLADLYLKTDEKSSAEKAFRKALQIAPDTASSYHLVAATYLLNREYEKAIGTYKSGIKRLDNPPLLLKELAGIYEITGDYALAIETYFTWAKKDTSRYGEVERKTMKLIETGIQIDELEKGLKKIISLEPKKSLGYKLYGDLLLKKGDFDKAFPLFKTADLLSSAEGQHLLLFAQSCLKKEAYELSFKTSQYLENHCQKMECVIQAKFLTASSLLGLKKYDEALKTYLKITRDYPIREIQAQVYLLMGDLYLEDLKNKDEAKIWYGKILPLKETTSYPATLIKLGKCYLLKNQLDSALHHYQKSLNDPLAQGILEELNFHLAEIYFHQGNLEKALQIYQQIIKDFPKGMFMNNSLERLNLIKDNLNMNRPFLNDFSRASLLIYQDSLSEAEKLLEKIILANVPNLSDAALIEKSILLRQKKDFGSSISGYQDLMKKFPQSLYLPIALKSIGDIYLENLKEAEKAKKTYELFLKLFPSSLYAQEVRENLKRLIQGS